MSEDAASRYVASRQPTRYRHYQTEETLLDQWLRLCEPGATVLDFPCGTGRFSELIGRCGHRLIRADLSLAMLSRAKELGPGHHVMGDVLCDLAQPPFADGSVEIVILWRLFHHLQSAADRLLVLAQAARLARRYVILSYYNRASLTYACQRCVRVLLGLSPKLRGAIRTSDLLDAARTVGLEPLEVYHYRRYISLNSAVCFRVQAREEEQGSKNL